jgi:hypothetical protein
MKGKLPLFLVMAAICGSARAVWTPPDHPDPQEVLNDAIAEITPLRYSLFPGLDNEASSESEADALARLVWFEQNAVKLQPALSGVRDSFALSNWHYLATIYPPALEELKAARTRAETRVRDDIDTRQSFAELIAIDRQFDAEARSVELFGWLDENRPEVAKQMYVIAQPALIETKQFALCGKYLDATKELHAQIRFYRWARARAEKPPMAGLGDAAMRLMSSHVEQNIYVGNTTTLVALLVLNGRNDQAADIAMRALKELDDADYRAQMDKALLGQLPPTWPPKEGSSVIEKMAALLKGAFKAAPPS